MTTPKSFTLADPIDGPHVCAPPKQRPPSDSLQS